MANVQFNPSLAVDEAGMDDIGNNFRVRATKSPVTVGTVTFPANSLGFNYYCGSPTAPITTTTASTVTLDAGQLLSGIVVVKPSAANVNVTLPTAAAIVAGLNAISSGCQVGDVVQLLLTNGAATTNTLTPTVNTGVTFDPNQAATTIAAATSRVFLFRVTNATLGSEAVIAYW